MKSFLVKIIFSFIFIIFLLNLVSAEQREHIVLTNDYSFVFMENTGTGNYNSKHVIKTTIRLPHEISAGDLDNDGIWDAAVNHWQDGKFSVFWGSRENEEISFIEQVFDITQVPRKTECSIEAACHGRMHAIGIGDFNEDGFSDLVLVDNGAVVRSVVIAFSDGKRGWSKFDRYEMPNNGNARRVKVDDFNNDRHLDFIVPETLSDSFYIFFGNGKGNFDIIENTKGFRLHDIETGDIDNDGDKDLIITDFTNILLLKNDGNGEFSNFKSFCVQDSNKQCIAGDFLSVEAVDLNKDGFLDIVAIKNNGIYIWKRENEEFKPAQYIQWSFDRVLDIEKADVDNNENIDIVAGVFNSPGNDAYTGISVFKGKGDATFFTPGKLFLAEKVNTEGGINQVMIDVYYEDVKEQEGPKFLRGDSDSNGNLELTDAIFILRYLFQGGETPKCLDAADVDDNGLVGIGDPIRILRYLFQGYEAPAVPYPNPGVDPSADDLGCEKE